MLLQVFTFLLCVDVFDMDMDSASGTEEVNLTQDGRLHVGELMHVVSSLSSLLGAGRLSYPLPLDR